MDISWRNTSTHYICIHFGYSPRTRILNAKRRRRKDISHRRRTFGGVRSAQVRQSHCFRIRLDPCQAGDSETKNIHTGTGLAVWVCHSNVRMGVHLNSMAPNGGRMAASGMCRTRRQTLARGGDHDRRERARASWVAPAARSRRTAGLSPSPQQRGVGPDPHPSLSGSAGQGGQQRQAGAQTHSGCKRG